MSDRLAEAIQQVEAALHQKELELADLSRCRYIARPKPKDKPHHAKAGNINYAIFSGKTSGQFILTLDADHIPKPNFLKRVLPYFFTYNLFTGQYENNRTAFVQTPQDFYNLPLAIPSPNQREFSTACLGCTAPRLETLAKIFAKEIGSGFCGSNFNTSSTYL